MDGIGHSSGNRDVNCDVYCIVSRKMVKYDAIGNSHQIKRRNKAEKEKGKTDYEIV